MGFQKATSTETSIALVERSMKEVDDFVAVFRLRSAYHRVDHNKLLALCE